MSTHPVIPPPPLLHANPIYTRNSKWAKPGPYLTRLPARDEATFQQWVKTNNIPFDPSALADYDMRGFWKAQQAGDPNAQRAVNLHFPDTWKTPYHKSFSAESIYALPTAPRWKDNTLLDQSGNVVFSEPPQ